MSPPSTNQLLLDELTELAQKLGATVERVRRGGDGGGLVRLRGREVLYVDTDAMAGDELDRLASQLASLGDLDAHYVSPALRERMS